jgi:hypothetical protein
MFTKQNEKGSEHCELAPNEPTMRANYVWEESYRAAILETDDRMLPNLLQTAKGAIDTRVQSVQKDHNGVTPEELQAIADALAGLSVLRRELQRRFLG